MAKRKVHIILFSILIILVVSSLPFIAACQRTSAPGPSEPAVTPAEKPAEKTVGDPIVIGVPISRGYPDGINAERGVTTAVDEINAEGGINVGGIMRPIKLELADTRDLEPGVPATESLLVVEKLILQTKVDFIVGGPIRSECALAVMDSLAKYKKISILSAGVLTPAYENKIAEDYDTYKYCFRTTGNVVPMVGEIVDTLESLKAEKGWNKIFIVVQDVAHARASGESIVKGLEGKGGWDILGSEIYPTGSTDFSTALLKAKNGGANFLFIWFDMPEASILMKQWTDMQLTALPIGYIHALKDEKSWDATDGKCAYSVTIFAKAGPVATPAIPPTAQFVETHKKLYGIEPENEWCSTSYTVAYILKDAIERAGTTDTDAVITALEQIDMMGTYGKVKFDPKSHQIVYSTDPNQGAVGLWAQWLDGKRVSIFPKAIASGDLQLPPWME